MRSSEARLSSRGYIHQEELNKDYSTETLLSFLYSNSASNRSLAVRLLSERGANKENELTPVFLGLLQHEKALYTKIELCRVLEQGDKDTALSMVDYLGRIGNNQYRGLPELVSKKKSYPLPRDIVARTLGNMNASILPVLLNVIKGGDHIKIREAIDAVGFMCFYNDIEDEKDVVRALATCFYQYATDEVIRWKMAICLSAFKSKGCFNEIMSLYLNETNDLIRQEVKRSLKLAKMNS